MERRLENLQKEYESLSEAHNSLEQLNSNWSEQNMEQKTKIDSMVKEVDELKIRLAQAEEGIKLQKETNEELRDAYSNEVLQVVKLNLLGVYFLIHAIFVPYFVNCLYEATSVMFAA